MYAVARSLRGRALMLLAVLVLASLVAPTVRAEQAASESSSRKPAPLGWVLASAPRAPHPWHKYGEFTFGGSIGWSQYQDHTDANDDGSLSNIDAKDGGLGWHLDAGFVGRYAGVEIGYMDLGSSKFDATSSGGSSWLAGDVSAEVEGSGWTFSGLVRIPVKPR